MPRVADSNIVDNIDLNLTSLVDVVFQMIAFFVMLMAVAKDETAQRVNLPIASSAPVLKDDNIPDSINISVDKRSYLLGWGREINLKLPNGMEEVKKLIENQARLLKEKVRRQGGNPKKTGLPTTVIMRFDEAVDYGYFREILDFCNKAGFTKYMLKIRGDVGKKT